MSNVPSSPLIDIFGSSSSAALIVFLVINHGSEFSLKEIADRTKISRAKISKMKDGLLKHGVLRETRKEGKTSYYRYERNSKFGKLLYDLVFNAGAASQQKLPAPLPSQHRPKGKGDGMGDIIFA
jgi:hypothetical protein